MGDKMDGTKLDWENKTLIVKRDEGWLEQYKSNKSMMTIYLHKEDAKYVSKKREHCIKGRKHLLERYVLQASKYSFYF